MTAIKEQEGSRTIKVMSDAKYGIPAINQRLADHGLPPIEGTANTLDVWRLSMSDVQSHVERTFRYWPTPPAEKTVTQMLAVKALGQEARVAHNLAESDAMIEEALAYDPRLARRSSWRRGEEGEIGCPALIAQGDDAPFFHRQRSALAESNGGEPVRVVISSDSSEPKTETAAAFIATIRIVQQFRPVEVWWQGAWLDLTKTAGWVFHVPLVQGDMDFTRLDFCINDKHRDYLSWHIMMCRAFEVTRRVGWQAGVADRSYLPERAHFISHTGVRPEDWSIAMTAANWLGLEYHGSEEFRATYGAEQKLPELTEWGPDTGNYAERERVRLEKTQAEAAARAKTLSRNF